MMKYEFSTDGEHLVYFLGTRLLHNVPWNEVSQALLVTGRHHALCEFFEEVTLVNLACRLVAAGTSLMRESKESPTRPARDTDDPTLQQDLRWYLRERLLIAPELVDDVLRVVIRAVKATRENVTVKERKRYKRHAQRTHQHCYMCGVTLDFSEQDEHTRFTLEHIWPRCYGGNSIDENLLPACGSCNSKKKRDLATWAMSNVQAVILGFSPDEEERRLIEGPHRYALHYYAARKLATRRQITLKKAFLRLKPWTDVRLKDLEDMGDFFNLANHEPFSEIE
jgi:5-methylcytosine-specific restriction endonuclease McrA